MHVFVSMNQRKKLTETTTATVNSDEGGPGRITSDKARILGTIGPWASGGRDWLFILARDVFWVVRHSRMWCPHDIGRDSWVWGEQETLEIVNSPHKVGGGSRLQEELPVGRKRSVPRV